VAGLFVRAGASRIRLTGGEPLLKPDLPDLVRRLARRPGVRELALTTNGVLLAERAAELAAAGLRRLTVSLDTLSPSRFRELTRRDDHRRVLAGLDAARAAGFSPLKLDAVLVRGFNDDEVVPLVEFARGLGAEVRFIEYMDVGGATRWTAGQVVSRAEVLATLEAHYGPLAPAPTPVSAPAERFTLPDGTAVGVIASVTAPFCDACDRSRVTADGRWFTCLYAAEGVDLRPLLRSGAGDDEWVELIRRNWSLRRDRGALERAGLSDRRVIVPIEALRRSPHREMHTRGG
jgi:cyclic pyranopterin phosphate synthase